MRQNITKKEETAHILLQYPPLVPDLVRYTQHPDRISNALLMSPFMYLKLLKHILFSIITMTDEHWRKDFSGYFIVSACKPHSFRK